MVRILSKSIISFLLVTGLIIATAGFLLAKSPPDMDNNWAKDTIEQWVDRGLITGYGDDTFRPDNEITRAEVAALINRSFDYSKSSNITFSDVHSNDWYFNDVKVAIASGFMSGYPDGTFKPKASISRQELAVIIAKLLDLSPSDSYKNIADSKNSPEWSKGAIGAVIDAKVMNGYPDQSFQPNKFATRAEVVVILDNAFNLDGRTVTYYYNKPGTYGPTSGKQVKDGNVVINATGVTLNNMTINGDLLLGAGIGDGDAYIKNVLVKGITTIEGGGANSIHFEDSVLVTVIVNKHDNSIRIVIEGTSTIQEVVLQSGAKLEQSDDSTGGGFSTVTLSELLPVNSLVELQGTFETVDVLSKSIKISIPQGSIENLNVASTATDTNIDISKDAKIVALILDAATKIVGDGGIGTATVNVNGTTFEKAQKRQSQAIAAAVRLLL